MPGHATKPNMGRNEGSRRIASLHVHADDQVFIGYGDWEVNDGATDLVSLDPSTGTYTVHELAVRTEAFQRFRSIDGVLYAPFTDPVGYWEASAPYTTVPAQPVGMGGWAHVFDVVKHGGRLWVFGSSLHEATGIASAAWSEDQGLTWNFTYPGNQIGDYARATAAGVEEGTLWCSVNDVRYDWDGTEWIASMSRVPTIPTVTYPQLLEGVTATARTSTHWVVGTNDGLIYTRPID